MSEIIVHLDQQDHKDIHLGQKDESKINLGNTRAVYGGLDFEATETDSGYVKYNSDTKKFTTTKPDVDVLEGSENIVTSDAVKKYIDKEIKKVVGFAPEDLDTLEETANKIVENQQKVEEALKNAKQYTAGEGLNLTDGGEFSVASATETKLGGLRVWEEDGYLCFSTEPYMAFVNSMNDSMLTMSGVWLAQQEGSTLNIQ